MSNENLKIFLNIIKPLYLNNQINIREYFKVL